MSRSGYYIIITFGHLSSFYTYVVFLEEIIDRFGRLVTSGIKQMFRDNFVFFFLIYNLSRFSRASSTVVVSKMNSKTFTDTDFVK